MIISSLAPFIDAIQGTPVSLALVNMFQTLNPLMMTTDCEGRDGQDEGGRKEQSVAVHFPPNADRPKRHPTHFRQALFSGTSLTFTGAVLLLLTPTLTY
jgi:hypothetical protein